MTNKDTIDSSQQPKLALGRSKISILLITPTLKQSVYRRQRPLEFAHLASLSRAMLTLVALGKIRAVQAWLIRRVSMPKETLST